MTHDESEAVARPYARALMAASTGNKAAVHECLMAAARALSDPSVALAAANPHVARDALALALKFDAPCSAVNGLVRLLLENGRLGFLPSIATAFAELKDASENVARATVTSAFALSERQVDNLRAALARRTERHVELTLEIDVRLMAGVIVQQGDMVLDGSARGRLEALAQALSPF